MARGRTITKGIAFGSVAAVAVAGVYLSQSLPGRAASSVSSAAGTTTSSSSGTTTGSAPTSTGPTGSSQGSGISAPSSRPAAATRQAPVVSGAS
jgi:hypothetical protein